MSLRRLVLHAAIILLGSVSAFVQTNPNIDQGMKPYGSFHGGALDSVSLTSGNLFFHKTEYAAAQRGRVELTFSLQYNNKGFRLQITCVNGSRGPWQMPPSDALAPSNGGLGCTANYKWIWMGSGVGLISDQSLIVGSSGPGIPVRVDSGFVDGLGNDVWVNVFSAWTSDGSGHPLADTGSGYRSIDASGIRWDGVSVVSGQDRDGMYFGGSTDTNGNFLSRDSSNNYLDTLVRVIPPPPSFGSTQTLPASTASLSSCPNLNLPYQPVVAAYSWNPPGPTGTSPFILCYASVYIRTALFGGVVYANSLQFHDVSQSVNMLQSVVRPDGSAWTFTYDGANPNDTTSIAYGDLLKISFPMGGSLAYTYATTAPYQGQYVSGMPTTSSRSVMTRTVDANDGTGPHTWKYSWVNVLTNTLTNYVAENTVTDPLGNDTVHQITGFFGGPSLYETQTRSYQGSRASGTLLKTVNTDYSYTSNPFDHLGPNTNPPTAINVVPIRVTTIWPNGQTSKVETDHDSAFVFRDPIWGTAATGTTFTTATYSGTLGTASARREFDYGGALLQQTFTTYLWQGNGNYLTANMLDLPATVKVLDGSGNLCAETDYFYDESGYLTTPSPAITTQHVAPPAAVRGNLTTVTRKLSATPCAANATWTNVDSHTNWLDTGEVYQNIDPMGHATTHTYDSAYAGAYPTQTCNVLNQYLSGTYDFNTGLPTSFTDANQQTSNFSFDQQWRLTQALSPTDPASGVRPETDFDYSVLNQVKRSKKLTPSAWIVDYAYFDGIGRTKETRLVDPAGDDFVDTTYDAAGRVSTVSNPHRSSPSTTDGSTQTQYDALARPTLVTKPDGSVSRIAYDVAPPSGVTGNCTTSTDEAGKQRKACSDALGRLTAVFEDPAGLNYETDYQYNALGNLVRVDQKGSAPTTSGQWRTRTFFYDSLSRLITAYNPESGTICYGVWVNGNCVNGYDANGNLLSKTDARAITTSYSYDALNRVTQETFSNGDPTLTFTYDQSPDPTWGAGNSVGHLVRALKSGLGSHWFRYDVMGRVARTWQCLPSAPVSRRDTIWPAA